MSIDVKTLDQHRTYVYGTVGLSLFFVWHWQALHPEEAWSKTFTDRTLLKNLCGYVDQPYLAANTVAEEAWDQIAARLQSLYQACRTNEDVERFEYLGLEALKPELDAYLPLGYQQDIAPLNWAGGSLRYENKPLIEEHANWCVFHIANGESPKSIFDDRHYLAECLLNLMEQSEHECGYDTLYTFTWLNSCPRWLSYFPEEWQHNLEPPHPEIYGNLGFWGQIINARKLLNEKTVAYIRQNMELRYKPRKSHCSFASMRRHLARIAGTE